VVWKPVAYTMTSTGCSTPSSVTMPSAAMRVIRSVISVVFWLSTAW
jgi:hypothetical protein